MVSKMEVKYGRIEYQGKICGYVTWNENGKKIELISIPYGPLLKFIDGEQVKPTPDDVMIWTRVAGLLGTEELYLMVKNKLFVK